MPKGETHRGLAGMAGTALAILGGRHGEQRRPPTYDRGRYRGGSDRMLEDQQVEMLSQRTAGQRF